MAFCLQCGNLFLLQGIGSILLPDGTPMCRFQQQNKDEGKVARLAGIEPTTLGFGGQYSIH